MTALHVSEREALGLLTELAYINEQLSPLEKRKRELTDQLKQWMALEDREDLLDGERGLVARLQSRNGTPTYDVVSLVKDAAGAEALVDAASAGMVRVDHAMLDRFRKQNGATWADLIERVQIPGTGTVALVIEKARS